MKLKTTQPKPSHELELTHEEVHEALRAYMRRKLKGLPKGARAPGPRDELTITAVAHGSQSNGYITLNDSCGTVTVEW